jgi:hypothetical protein
MHWTSLTTDNPMDITLRTVTDAARLRVAAVTAEAAGYLVLLVVQQVASRPCHLSADSVLLTEAGDVSVRPGEDASALAVEVELRQLLAGLMALAHSSTPALRAGAERRASGDLAAFQAELQAALIPINHAAARRALARLYRETQKAGPGVVANGAMTAPALPGSTATVRAEQEAAPSQHLSLAPARVAGGEAARSSLPSPLRHADPAEAPAGPRAREALELDSSYPQAELEIDVDVIGEDGEPSQPPSAPGPSFPFLGPALVTQLTPVDDAPRASSLTPISTATPVSAAPLRSEQLQGRRSDVGELLGSFLSHTRCERTMAEDLRRMLGIACLEPATPGGVSAAAQTAANYPPEPDR